MRAVFVPCLCCYDRDKVAAHLAKMGGAGSSARQVQRIRSICRAFFDECRSAESDAERGVHDTAAAPVPHAAAAVTPAAAAAASADANSEAGGAAREGVAVAGAADAVRARLHECAGFVAVLSLLLQPFEEWERCKRFVVVSCETLPSPVTFW